MECHLMRTGISLNGGSGSTRAANGAFFRLIHPENRSAENARERFIRSGMTCRVRGAARVAPFVANTRSTICYVDYGVLTKPHVCSTYLAGTERSSIRAPFLAT